MVKKLYHLHRCMKEKKFKMGGTSPEGFDASGYTQYVYKTAATHLPIPRTSNDQYKAGKSIKKQTNCS